MWLFYTRICVGQINENSDSDSASEKEAIGK